MNSKSLNRQKAQTVRLRSEKNRNTRLILCSDSSVHLLHVDALFGGGLEEGEPELFGELAAARRADDALVLEIALVAHQNHLQHKNNVSVDRRRRRRRRSRVESNRIESSREETRREESRRIESSRVTQMPTRSDRIRG